MRKKIKILQVVQIIGVFGCAFALIYDGIKINIINGLISLGLFTFIYELYKFFRK